MIVVRLYGRDREPPDMTSPRAVGRLAASVVAGGFASATVATLVSGAADRHFFVSWFATVTLGMMIVAPLILTIWGQFRHGARAQVGRSGWDAPRCSD
ncbi:hypothetical protein AB5I41_12345 [Sphingomonas sp. MMS24-JH45]